MSRNGSGRSRIAGREWVLWLLTVGPVVAVFLLVPDPDWLTLCSAVIGITSVLLIAKGWVLGEFLTAAFTGFYGAVAAFNGFYGEVISAFAITLPLSVLSIIAWIRHPFPESGEVEVGGRIPKKQIVLLLVMTPLIAVSFFFLLRSLGTVNAEIGTASVALNAAAAFMKIARNPYFPLVYGVNDLVLITLWVLASLSDSSNIPMVACFLGFLISDIYAWISWIQMKARQKQTREREESGRIPGTEDTQ
ncbi:MAG: nicotinamide mononucleotide transporter [Clostridia bacterium]|nr:nicotinamide mononucleotide transporter [Clostridia bacterium]